MAQFYFFCFMFLDVLHKGPFACLCSNPLVSGSRCYRIEYPLQSCPRGYLLSTLWHRISGWHHASNLREGSNTLGHLIKNIQRIGSNLWNFSRRLPHHHKTEKLFCNTYAEPKRKMLEITNGIIVPDEEDCGCQCRLCKQSNVGWGVEKGGKGVKGEKSKG